MKTSAIIEGLTILQKYRDRDGHDCDARYEELHADATDRPIEQPDLARLIELGWFQEYADYPDDEEFTEADYDPGESWECYT